MSQAGDELHRSLSEAIADSPAGMDMEGYVVAQWLLVVEVVDPATGQWRRGVMPGPTTPPWAAYQLACYAAATFEDWELADTSAVDEDEEAADTEAGE